MGKIHHIEVENFKSYKGRQIIGPFEQFSCIIGPNGSGKSNLMDAIGFVMGVRASDLRSTQLQQLIYRADGEAAAKRLRCHVELFFEQDDGTEIRFKRTITSAGASEYRIDDSVVTWDEYNKKLKSFDILTKARNFLVFQGDVESIASKTPKELTALLEQVSGSDEYKDEYEKLKQARDQAAEKVLEVSQKKKEITHEKNQFKHQKEEADRYQALNEEHKETRQRYMLFQLYFIEKEIARHKKDLEKYSNELKKAEQKHATVEEQLKTKNTEHANLRKDLILLNKEISKKNKNLFKKKPEHEKLKVEIEHTTKALDKQRSSLDKKRQEYEQHQKDIKQFEKEMADVEKKRAQYEKELEEIQGEEVKLQDEQLDEYNRLKKQAGARTITLRQEADQIQAQINSEHEVETGLQGRLNALEERKKQLEKSIASLNNRVESLNESIEENTAKMNELKTKKEQITKENETKNKRKAALEQQLSTIREKLLDARVERKENEREGKLKEAIESLKRLYPGVHGRMIDLCKIRNTIYSVAVTVAMGKNMDAVVVDDEKTAMECIEYLREQRVGVTTFIPLDTIKAKKINEKYRRLGGSFKLVIDLVTFDASLETALRYAVGNTLYCDTLDEARALAFEKVEGERYKVVTRDGTLIHKSGLMTGGRAGVQARAMQWENKSEELAKLKKQRDQCLTELAEIARAPSTVAAEEELTQQISAFENRIKYTQREKAATEKTIKSHTEDLGKIDDEIDSIRPNIERSRATSERLTREKNAILDRIRALEDEIYADFSARVGVENIREYEERQLRAAKERAQKRSEFDILLARLQNRLDYERNRDLKGPIDQLEESIKEKEKSLDALKKKEEKLANEINKIEEDIKDQSDRAKELRKKIDDKETEINELKRIADGKLAEVGKSKKHITLKENQVEQLRNRRQELVLKCRVDEIEIPMLEGGEEESGATKRRRVGRGRKTTKKKRMEEGEEEEGAEEEEEEGEGEGEEQFDSSESFSISQAQTPTEAEQGETEVRAVAAEFVRINFASLPEEYRRVKDEAKYNELIKKLEEQLKDMVEDLEKLAPNLRAMEKLNEAKKELKQTSTEFEKAKEESDKANAAFEAIKKKRYDAFMAAFTPIKANIENIYKALTKSTASPLGGNAYLDLEEPDSEEPYLHGIKYSVIPPRKRFRDMNQLSGGEKTVAALALLFAIHSYRPSPFLILDEVDAALDHQNVQRVANYIQERADQGKCQFVVISLKDVFFERADSLVGVYKDQPEKCSKVLTLRLMDYPQPEK